MKKLLILAVLAILGWQAYTQHRGEAARVSVSESAGTHSLATIVDRDTQHTGTQDFKCDGRTHCSQMTSCAEANFFLRNCPGVKMDGNNDGVPCEQQWCR